ncbi:MAG TPA: M28 family metallopeptidase [Terracidiphilus sp.]|nr:M28 family metallopeptidase [Terracidiphilus sp.]
MIVRKALAVAASFLVLPASLSTLLQAQASPDQKVPGFADFSTEARIENEFLAAPSAKQAGNELRVLTAAPHVAGTPEDHDTALYVAREFRAAGLDTEIVPYRVLIDWPKEERVEAWDASGHRLLAGPTRAHVKGDPYSDDPRIIMPYNASSASGDVTAQVVYANYGRLQDFQELTAKHIDVRGKIVICRYGGNFRGVKVYLAEQRGAVGVLVYSDPQDDGYYKGDVWPNGPWRPATAVQRGSVQYLFKYPGDPETPGFASTPNLPDTERKPPDGSQPHIVSIPISYQDASPILQALQGPGAPEGWQGALPFSYHLGPGGVTVHLVSKQDFERRLIWNVIGKIEGSQDANDPVIVGNHRDAWTFGAVDPSSGTAVMLEAVHGVGALLKTGWRPKRTILFCSWDGEEEGLIGSTEWVEQYAPVLQHAVAYFNVDIGVSGSNFAAAAVPSLKQFILGVTRDVPSPKGDSVYDQWVASHSHSMQHPGLDSGATTLQIRIGDLGSGSDYTPFLQHIGVPSTDVSSEGSYGVYHSASDDFAWFTREADPHFVYLQQMARVLGLEAVRMADADVLPYDYVTYAREIGSYLDVAKARAKDENLALDFAPAVAAAARLGAAAQKVLARESAPAGNIAQLNAQLRQVEADFLDPAGLPNRPWYKHLIFAPGEYTGYSAVVIPGVNEAIDAHNRHVAAEQLAILTQALNNAARALESIP